MENNELPDKIIPIKMLRVNREAKKKNNCEHGYYEIDVINKEVTCTECGAVVSAYDAILDICRRYERLEREANSILAQRREIMDWKPWLLPMRKLEKIYRGGEMLPCCPHCGRGIESQELIRSSVNKQHEIERRKFERK